MTSKLDVHKASFRDPSRHLFYDRDGYHHITLSGNVPFEKSASFFASFSKHLIIEFPKREDS